MEKNEKQSTHWGWKTILLIAFFLSIGVGLMAYPFISNYLFEHRQDSLIGIYEDQADEVEDDVEEEELEKARDYNRIIFSDHVQLQDPFKAENKTISREEYQSLLNLQGTGLIGFVKIPCIHVELPIYHGTEESTLENGVGHLEGTSLPIGGETTHAVLTGHTGLNKAKLFTDLSQMEEGDQFYLYVLKEKLAYEVDQILVVEPENTEDLGIVPGKDYCTLITCTPYGVNSHRLLVRGHRIPYEEKAEEEQQKMAKKEESLWMRQYKRALMIGFCVIVAIVALNRGYDHVRRKKTEEKLEGS